MMIHAGAGAWLVRKLRRVGELLPGALADFAATRSETSLRRSSSPRDGRRPL